MRPHLRVMMLGAAWLTLGGVVSVQFHASLREVGDETARLAHQDLPASLEMSNLRDAMSSAQIAFRRVVRAEDAGELVREKLALMTSVREVRALLANLTSSLASGEGVGSFEAGSAAVEEWLREVGVGADAAARGVGQVDEAALRACSERFDEAKGAVDAFVEGELMPGVRGRAARVEGVIGEAGRRMAGVIGAGVGVGFLLTALVARSAYRQQRSRDRMQARQEFDGRVSHALSMTECEDDALRLVEEVLERVRPGVAAEVLLADSSRAHVFRAAATRAAAASEKPMCGVRSPSHCAAVRRGFEMTFQDSGEFDACPYLRGRDGGACSATCVPISVMGQQVGVMHVVTPAGEPLDRDSTESFTVVAAKAGERIGFIRAFNQSEEQAAKDTLTGLLNRRSAEQRVQQLQRSGTSFCVAYADIDHFKKLNDTHGHETGDRALRFFSRVLTDTLRPTDVIARWGGEEFVILLVNAGLDAASATLERLREAVEQATGQGTVPKFTASFGVTECQPGDTFSERLHEADAALLVAKKEGRNRVITAGAMPSGEGSAATAAGGAEMSRAA